MDLLASSDLFTVGSAVSDAHNYIMFLWSIRDYKLAK